MAIKKKLFSFDTEYDEDVLAFLARQPNKKESDAIKRAIRFYEANKKNIIIDKKEVYQEQKKEVNKVIFDDNSFDENSFDFGSFTKGKII